MIFFPNLVFWSQQSSLIKGMLIKVREMTFRFCKNLSLKLCDYSMWTGSWLLTLATTANQPFGMHFKHVRVPANSSCLLPLLGPRFFLTPSGSPILIWVYARKFHLSMPLDHSFNNTHYVHDVISWKSLTFISLVTWCGTFV
jgi:hypothetical protein